ncbi:DUF4870 domain-containing protein [Aerosakkonemataceae cyanobacterium BLCC-F154]|uniref:DUF4870 domain-containing protein n=1 Tax=Floridaenema fluviatile BLCC-F154 TaxID=3153640 RepID=A0ABV4YAQ2_9CYAN
MTHSNETEEIRTWGMWAHLSSLVWIPLMFVGLSFPVLNIIGPLIVWLYKRKDHEFIDAQGKESLNFQLSFTLYNFILALILIVVGVIIGLTVITAPNQPTDSQAGGAVFGLGLVGFSFLLAVILAIAQLILVIIAARKAKKGEFYVYPLTIRFLR